MMMMSVYLCVLLFLFMTCNKSKKSQYKVSLYILFANEKSLRTHTLYNDLKSKLSNVADHDWPLAASTDTYGSVDCNATVHCNNRQDQSHIHQRRCTLCISNWPQWNTYQYILPIVLSIEFQQSDEPTSFFFQLWFDEKYLVYYSGRI